jgi:hypothetical protein
VPELAVARRQAPGRPLAQVQVLKRAQVSQLARALGLVSAQERRPAPALQVSA